MNDYEDEGYNLLPVIIAALAGRGIARSVAAPTKKGKNAALKDVLGRRRAELKAAPDAAARAAAKAKYAPEGKKVLADYKVAGTKRADRSGLAGLLAAGGAASLMDNDTSDLFSSGLTGVALGGHLGNAFKRLPQDSAVRKFIPYENPLQGAISGGITGGALGLGAGYTLQPEQRENEYFGY